MYTNHTIMSGNDTSGFYNNTLINDTITTTRTPIQTPGHISYEQMGQIALHTFIFVGGMLGNVFVVTIILKRKKMQTITNWFVFNLAISDLAIIIFVIPLTNIIPLMSWPFGEVVCKYLLTPVLEHFAGVCVLTHAALSVARYIVVISAMSGKRLNLFHVKISIALIWFVAFTLMSVPLMGIAAEFNLEQSICLIEWKSTTWKLVYRFNIFFLTYVVPMVTSGYAYSKIHKVVSNSLKHLHGHMSAEGLSNRRRKSRRMDRVLMTMYVMFGITTLPLQVFYIFNDLGLFPISTSVRLIWQTFLALFYAQVVSNPLVLFYMGEEYRKELYRLPVCICAPPQRIRRLSTAFRGSVRSKRTSTVSQNHFKNADSDSKTRLMNGEKRSSTPNGSKQSNDTLYITNGYYGNRNKTNNNSDILQTALYVPGGYNTEQMFNYMIPDNQESSNLPNGIVHGNLGEYNLQTHTEQDEDFDDNASSFLYNSDSQKSLEKIEHRKLRKNIDYQSRTLRLQEINRSYLTPELPDQSDLVYKSITNNQPVLSHELNHQLESTSPKLTKKELLEETELLTKKYSRDETLSLDSVTAFYEDGSLHYMYDCDVGSIEHDGGRETTI